MVRGAGRLLQDREHPQDRLRLHTGPRGWASSLRVPPSPSPAITRSQEEAEEGIFPPPQQTEPLHEVMKSPFLSDAADTTRSSFRR